MQLIASICVILVLAVSPITEYMIIHKEILYTRTGCLNKLTSCRYSTPEQLLVSNIHELRFVNHSSNFTTPLLDIGIVYNGLNSEIDQIIASILFLRVKKCTLQATVIYNDLSIKRVNILRFLPNTNVIKADNISMGLIQTNYKQILFVNEPIFFLMDPVNIMPNIFFPSTKKYFENDSIWSLYGKSCINEYIPSRKFASFNKSLLLNMPFNDMEIPTQLFMHALNSDTFKIEQFPNLVGTEKCQHSLLYNYNGKAAFIDAHNLNIDTVVRFTIGNCNTYPSAVFNGCYDVSDYGVVSQRTKSDSSGLLKKDLETIKDALDMSRRFVQLEPFEN